jgi:hypothetical protein
MFGRAAKGARSDFFAPSPVTKKKPVDAPDDPTTQLAPPKIPSDDLILWCQHHLGATPAAELFTSGHLSLVMGLRLSDGQEVVIKARPPTRRLSGCYVAQNILHARGFPCPQPLVAPAPLGALSATAERYVAGGEPLAPQPHTTELYASALAQLLTCAPTPTELPSVEPAPPWAGWDHGEPGVWPVPDDRDAELNAHPGPLWLDDLGRRVRARLANATAPDVIGHVDWEAHNLRWIGQQLHAVHDWDSIAARPEATIVGLAAAVHTASGEPLTEATDEQVEGFLTAYGQARGHSLTSDERELAWAAGLWVRAFNAKKDSLDGDGPSLDRLGVEAPSRLCLAGA